MATLRQLAPELRELRPQQWKVGYDGWVRDLTVRLPPLDSLALGLLLLDVHRALFGTTYKAQTLELRTEAAPAPEKLDLTVSAAELNRWLVLDQERFSSSGAAPGRSVGELLASRDHGVYFSTVPGLVVWLLPRHQNIARYRIDARRWALDTDIVLGGVADAEGVAIIARERTVAPEFLPPLRVETILQLAAATTEHLAQSYERTFALSGPVRAGTDWAPIYLSPELIDTEYGSLLNITDQMLKSWSQHGNVHYVNFRYPPPREYPFDHSLMEELRAPRVTFNWNTKGAGYVMEGGTLAVYALNRTGALPVSYFAGDDQSATDATLAAEQRAYRYFATIDDPNLARVVQYAALYQLFREFDVQARVQEPVAAGNPRAALRPQLLASLERFATTDRSTFDEFTDEEFRSRITDAQEALRSLREDFGRASLERISERLVRDPGDQDLLRADAELAQRFAAQETGEEGASAADSVAYRELLTARKVTPFLLSFLEDGERDRAMTQFERAAAPASRPWIHTASIVLSSDVSHNRIIGGHNLDAAVTRFRASSAVGQGEVHVVMENGRRVILANETDIARMSGNLRMIAGTRDATELETHLGALLQRVAVPTIRSRGVAVPFARRASGRGLLARRGGLALGYQPLARDLSAAEQGATALLASRGRAFTGVTKLADGGYEIVLGTSGEIVRAPNIVSALDVVTMQPRPSGVVGRHQYELYGFSDLDAAAFSRNTELAMRRRGQVDPDPVASIVMREGADEHAVLDAATRRLDITRTRVRDVREVDIELGGTLRRAVQVDVEVVTRAARRPLLVRIWLVFKEGVVRPAMDAIQGRVATILEALGRDVSADAAAAIIRIELTNSFGSIEHVRTQFDDIVLVYAAPRDRDGPQPEYTAV